MSPPPALFPWPRRASDSTPLGVDLTVRGHEVDKLTRKFAGGHRLPAGLSMEDLVQEVLFAVHRRNGMRSAFDPRRASFGHYVTIVARGVLLNLIEKTQTQSRIPETAVDPIESEDDLGAAAEPDEEDAEPDASDEPKRLPAADLLRRARAALPSTSGAPAPWSALAGAICVHHSLVSRALRGLEELGPGARGRLERLIRDYARGKARLPPDGRRRAA